MPVLAGVTLFVIADVTRTCGAEVEIQADAGSSSIVGAQATLYLIDGTAGSVQIVNSQNQNRVMISNPLPFQSKRAHVFASGTSTSS